MAPWRAGAAWTPKALPNRFCFERRIHGVPNRINRGFPRRLRTLQRHAGQRLAGRIIDVGSSSPRLAPSIEHLAQHRGGICFHGGSGSAMGEQADRWVRFQNLRYKAHVIEQADDSARAQHPAFSQPKLLEALREKVSLVKYGITSLRRNRDECVSHRLPARNWCPVLISFLYAWQHVDGACRPQTFDSPIITRSPISPLPRPVSTADPDDPEKEVIGVEKPTRDVTTLTRESSAAIS